MAGELITGDFQLEWSGLQLGGPSSPYGVTGVSGLGDLPGLVTADRERLRSHGTIAGDDFMTDRTVAVSLRIEGADTAAVRAATVALSRTIVPGAEESPLVFQIPGVADGVLARINCRARRKSLPIELGYEVGLVEGAIQFVATDPRIYDAVDTEQSVELASGDGGLSWPATWPAVWTTATESGVLTISNVGNFSSPWQARIDGPCTNPVIQNGTDGLSLGFSITLAAGEWLELDSSGSRSVLLNGTASRYYTITPGSTWWDFQPGDTEIQFSASTVTAALLTMTTRSAWSS